MLEMLYKRRSIREFKNIPLERERIEKITKAALLAPSSRGIRPWEFIIVESKQTLKLLSEAKASGSGFLADAPFAIARQMVLYHEGTIHMMVGVLAIAGLYAAKKYLIGRNNDKSE
jgi:nitroreductase